MTLAPGIEIAASGATSTALGGSSVSAHGTPRQAAIQGLGSSVAGEAVSGFVFGTGSFRSGWQALVATLAPKMDGTSEVMKSEVRGKTPADQAQRMEGGGSTRTVVAPTAGIDMHTVPASKEGSESASLKAGTELSAAVALRSFSTPADKASEQVLVKAEAKRPARAILAVSSSAQRSSRPIPADKQKVAAVDSLPGVVFATIESPGPTAPAAPADSSGSRSCEGKAQLARTVASDTELSATARDGSPAPSFTPNQLTPARFTEGGREDAAPTLQSKEASSITQGQELPVPSRIPALDSVPQALAALPDAHPSAADIQVSSQAARPSEKEAPSASPVQTFSPVQNLSGNTESVPGQETATVAAPDRVPAFTPLRDSPSAVPTGPTASVEDRASTKEPDLNPVRLSVTDQSSAREFTPAQVFTQALPQGSDTTPVRSTSIDPTPAVSRPQQESTVRARASEPSQFSSSSEQAFPEPVSNWPDDQRPAQPPSPAQRVTESLLSPPESTSGRDAGGDQSQRVQAILPPARTVPPRVDSLRIVEAAGDGQQRSAAVSNLPESVALAPDLSESPVASPRRTPASPPASNLTEAATSSQEPSQVLVPVSAVSRAATPELNPAAQLAPEQESSPGLFATRQETPSAENVGGSRSFAPRLVTQRPVQSAGASLVAQQIPAERPGSLESFVAPPVTSSQQTWSDEIPLKTPAAPPTRAISAPATVPVSGITAHVPEPVTSKPTVVAPLSTTAAAPLSVVATKPGSTGGGKVLKQETLRPARASGGSGTARHQHPLTAQPTVVTVEAPATAAGAAGVRGAVRLASELGEGSGAIAAPGSRETFEALDSESAMGRPAWVHTGAQRAEAGFEDPSLGWVGVRAESGGGRVHAEVVPGSTDAAQALSGHLAGLNAYLAEHHTQVETLTVATPESRSGSLTGGGGGGEQMQQGAGQQPGQQSAQGAGTGSLPNAPNGSKTQSSSGSGSAGLQGGTGGSAEIEARAGMHISVMA